MGTMGISDLRVVARRASSAIAPAAVGLATGVVALTLLVVVLGPILPTHGVLGSFLHALRAHPSSGLVSVLFAMGVPIDWKVSPVPLHGTIRPTSVIADFPVLVVATAVVALGAIVAGLLAARARDRDSKGLLVSGTSFALLVGAVSVAVSHARPMTLSRGVHADLNVSPLVAVAVGAGWAAMGTLVGLALHRRVAQRLSGRLVHAARTPVASGLVVLSFGLATLGCTGSAATTAAGMSKDGNRATSGESSTTSTSGATSTSPTTADGSSTSTTAVRGTSNGAGGRSGTGGSGAGTTSTTANGAGTAAPSGGTAASGSPSGSPSGSIGAAGLRPPTPGSYLYDTTGSLSYLGTTKAYPAVTTLVVDAAAGLVQHAVRNLTNGGDGFTIEQIYDYRPEGIAVNQQRLSVSLGSLKTVKTLLPTGSALWLGTNDGPGAHHEFDLQGKDIAGHEIVDVLRTEKITVGGQSVSADVVRTSLTFSGSANGSIVLDQWFVRSARVVGKEHLDGDVRASLVRLTTKYDAVLRRLTP